jgi:hypothetical protein
MSTLSHCCVILGKLSAFFEYNSIPTRAPTRRIWCHFAFRAFALGSSPPPTSTPSALRPKLLCFNTEYRCLRDDPLVRCEPIRSPYTNAFVDHRHAIASSVHDCAPPTNLVSPLVPVLPCIASERWSSRATSVSYCAAALRVDVVLPRFY